MEENKITSKIELLVIGGSAGSLDVILKLLPQLKPTLSIAIVIVLHRKSGGDYSLSDLLASRTSIKIKEVEDKQLLERGCIYVAPPDYHLLFEKDRTLSLDYSEKVNYSRPSIDVSFESAAEIFGASLAALLLSGANTDGARGLVAARHYNGTVLVQNPETAESPFMPEHAILHVEVDHIVNVSEMAAFINAI